MSIEDSRKKNLPKAQTTLTANVVVMAVRTFHVKSISKVNK